LSLKYPHLKDYIFKMNLLPEDVCDNVIKRLERKPKWEDHGWYDAKEQSSYSKGDFQTVKNDKCRQKVFPYIRDLCIEYNKKYFVKENTNSDIFWSTTGDMKFNKYSVGESIEPHHDHIHDMFDGKVRGIPTTSLIGVLNDDYEGGELLFWNEYRVDLKKGDVVAFPSVFLFPHEVTTVTGGIRYSWVTWCV
tara:strand:- start:1270 stop:1845 length:576 start_codon:yes stop_codon:yes gene_type:complete